MTVHDNIACHWFERVRDDYDYVGLMRQLGTAV